MSAYSETVLKNKFDKLENTSPSITGELCFILTVVLPIRTLSVDFVSQEEAHGECWFVEKRIFIKY